MVDLGQNSRWFLPALSAGASLLLFFGPWLVPLVGSLFSIWTPAPLLALYARKGPEAGRLGLGLGLAGALVLGAAMSSATGGLYYAYYAAVALVLGEAPRFGLSDARAVALAGFVAAGVVGGLLLGGSFFAGHDLGAAWEAQWQRELDGLMGSYRGMGLDQDEILMANRGLIQFGRIILKLAPGLLTVGSLLLAWANLLLARRTAALGGQAAPERQRLSLIRLPEQLVWPVIVAGAAVWAGEGWIYWTAVNVLLVLGVAYFFQGLAVLVFWLEKKNAPRVLRLGVYALLAIEVFLALLVALAGLFDVWFNFRRLEKTPPA